MMPEPLAKAVLNGTIPILITPHAVERYQERVRPALELTAACRALGQQIPFAELNEKRPEWLSGDGQSPAFYLMLGDAIAMPADPHSGNPEALFIRTVLTKDLALRSARPHRRRTSSARRAGRTFATSRRATRRLGDVSRHDWRRDLDLMTDENLFSNENFDAIQGLEWLA